MPEFKLGIAAISISTIYFLIFVELLVRGEVATAVMTLLMAIIVFALGMHVIISHQKRKIEKYN